MSILSLFGLGALIAGSEIKAGVTKSKAMDAAQARGAFRPDNKDFGMYFQDVSEDWRGEKKLFPKEYVEYFYKNPNALQKYKEALVSKLEYDAGFRPTLTIGTFNASDFTPFEGFEKVYLEKIKIFNETGKLYF